MVILDMTMPGLSGYDTFLEIRRNQAKRSSVTLWRAGQER